VSIDPRDTAEFVARKNMGIESVLSQDIAAETVTSLFKISDRDPQPQVTSVYEIIGFQHVVIDVWRLRKRHATSLQAIQPRSIQASGTISDRVFDLVVIGTGEALLQLG
jgi:hypothetical protein